MQNSTEAARAAESEAVKAEHEALISRAEHENLLAAALEAERKSSESKLRALRAEFIMRNALSASGAKNQSLIAKLLGSEEISVPDGEDFDAGFTAQVNAKLDSLRTSDPYLFEDSNICSNTNKTNGSGGSAEVKPQTAESGKKPLFFSSGAPHGAASPDLASLSDAEYYRQMLK